jgi:hypothetical protein
MSSPFSRTTRSLNADSFHTSLAGLTIALLLLTVWTAWFCMAEIAIYRTSLSARVTGKDVLVSEFTEGARRPVERTEKEIIAEFSPEDIGSIRPGQAAKVYLNTEPRAGIFSARVDQVTGTRVSLFGQFAKASIRQGETGQVKIQVDSVSPAVLVMRASGLFDDIPSGSE